MTAPIFLTLRAEPVPRWIEAFPDALVLNDRAAQAAQLVRAPAVWLHLCGDAPTDAARLKAVRALAPDVPLVALSNVPEDEQGLAVLAAGAAGYCSALTLPDVLRQVAAVVGQGGLWVGPRLMRRLLTALAAQADPTTAPLHALSLRERQIAEAAARGGSNKEIARSLGITERTVKAHLTAAYGKLGVRDRMQLALLIHGVEDSSPPAQRLSA